MKLFSERLTKQKFIILVVLDLIEIIGFIIIIIPYKSLYLKVFDETKAISIKKAESITNGISEIIVIYLTRYLQDAKLVGKHMSFFANKKINNASNFYMNIRNNTDKKIILGTLEKLEDNNIIDKIYIENNFSYFNVYLQKYSNNSEIKMDILNQLMNKEEHPELNCIALYSINESINSLDDDNKVAGKYLISILKTNIIKRFVVDGEKLEVTNYILINKDFIYIYPPKPFKNTAIYSQINKFDKCKNGSNSNFLGKCIYDYIIDIENITNENMIPIIPFIKIDYEYIETALCLNIPFKEKNDYLDSIICIESNLTKMFGDLFEDKEGFSSIFFTIIEGNIIPLYSNKKGIYDDIRKISNNKEIFEKYGLNNETFELFYFLYIDILSKSNLIDENKITIYELYQEYEIIKKEILYKIKASYNTTDHIPIDIEKTSCQSDIYNNGIKCMKTNFLIIVRLFRTDFFKLNKDFIEESISKSSKNMPVFFSMSIINNNTKYLKWKFDYIIKIKILKLFIFYFIFSMCLVYLTFILIEIFYESKYEAINKLLHIIKDGSFFEIKNKNEFLQKAEELSIDPNNKDMADIKNLFDYIVKIMILKINFEQNEISFDKNIDLNNIEKMDKNQISYDNILSDNNIDTLNEYIFANNIFNDETRLMMMFIISYKHFSKKLYQLSEKEFKNLIIEVNIYQNKISNKTESNDFKLKDSISRCSKISYLNEYSLNNELSETILPIIKIKLMTQKILYLYAMCIYNQEKIKSNNENNKKYNKENAKQRYEEAIKYFTV